MDQLTVRGLDDDLRARLRELSRERGVSLNRAASFLLRKGAGLDRRGHAETVGDALDDLIGSWSAPEAGEILAAIAPFEATHEPRD